MRMSEMENFNTVAVKPELEMLQVFLGGVLATECGPAGSAGPPSSGASG